MNDSAAWLLLSFAIMVVAMLGSLYEKCERLEGRLVRLEAEREHGEAGDAPRAAVSIPPFGRADHRPRHDHPC